MGRQTRPAGAGGRADAGAGVPRPLLGDQLDGNGDVQFGVEESATTAADGDDADECAGELRSAVDRCGERAADSAGEPGGNGCGGAARCKAGRRCTTALQAWTPRERGRAFVSGAGGDHVSGREQRDARRAEFFAGDSGVPGVPGNLAGAAVPDRIDRPNWRGSSRTRAWPSNWRRPPDANFDHANFYWRLELQPEYAATIIREHHGRERRAGDGGESVSQDAMARITRGRGAGQERAIAGNTRQRLTRGAAVDGGAGREQPLRGGGRRAGISER